MNKKGFTLIELLAVIVVLAVIMSIASTQVLKQKKLANEKEVESIYNSIKELGPDVYLNMDKISECKNENNVKICSAETLKNEGYLKSTIFNPANSKKTCGACLIIDTSKVDNMFDAYVDCEGLTPVGYYKGKKEVPEICKTDNTNETNSEDENMGDESSDEIEEIIADDYEEATE